MDQTAICENCGRPGIELVIIGIGQDPDTKQWRLVCAEWDGTRHDLPCTEDEAKEVAKALQAIGPGMTMMCQDAETLPDTVDIPAPIVQATLQAFMDYKRTGNKTTEGYGLLAGLATRS